MVCNMPFMFLLQIRSPSPEPIYNSEGKRLNTREFRVRKKLEEERHVLIQEAQILNEDYKPPADYKWVIVAVYQLVCLVNISLLWNRHFFKVDSHIPLRKHFWDRHCSLIKTFLKEKLCSKKETSLVNLCPRWLLL